MSSIGLATALRVYAREKTLDAKGRISSLVEVLLEESLNLVMQIGKDVYFRQIRFTTLRNPRWHMTTIVINMETKKLMFPLLTSHKRLRSDALQEALSAISAKSKIPHDRKIAMDALDARTRRNMGLFDNRLITSGMGCDMGQSTVVLLFATGKV